VARFYDIDEANARLPELRPVLEQLRTDREAVAQQQRELLRLRRTDGSQEHAAELGKRESQLRELIERMAKAVRQLDDWDIALRDIPSGLIDFPALASGRPIWLCWRLGEADVGWWHEPDTGFSDRRPLIELT
jgi:hypothetical protein